MNPSKHIKYDIGDRLYYYYEMDREITRFIVHKIRKDKEGTQYLRKNWSRFVGEDELYTDYDECLKDAKIRLQDHLFEEGWRNKWTQEEKERICKLYNKIERKLDEQQRPE